GTNLCRDRHCAVVINYAPPLKKFLRTPMVRCRGFHQLVTCDLFSLSDGPYLEPRLTSWYGEIPYTYSRSTMQPNPHWHPILTMLKDRIEEVTGHTFNSLLCNLYRHDKDSIDWHSDEEHGLGRNPVIASLSFGDTRVFQMRRKPSPVSDLSGDNGKP
ncbi:hypothetical protein FKM82_025595, partial [Ascaphus truei]